VFTCSLVFPRLPFLLPPSFRGAFTDTGRGGLLFIYFWTPLLPRSQSHPGRWCWYTVFFFDFPPCPSFFYASSFITRSCTEIPRSASASIPLFLLLFRPSEPLMVFLAVSFPAVRNVYRTRFLDFSPRLLPPDVLLFPMALSSFLPCPFVFLSILGPEVTAESWVFF